MDRFEYSSPNLQPGESYVLRSYNVKLYDGDRKTNFENGELILTSHRLMWFLPGTTNYLSLYLHYIVYVEEEKSTSFMAPRSSKRLILYLLEPPPTRTPGPYPTSAFNFVKLSFKDRIDGELVQLLNRCMHEKKWENMQPPSETKAPIKLRAGIVGIERSLEEKQKAANETISTAFQDMSKLMVMAKDMVTLSRSISTKIRDKQGDITDDETIKFKSYLLSLGVDDPVTRDAFQSQSEYFKQLANEIRNIMEKPLREVGGVIVLTDAYCRVNRARGLELLSPEDFLAGCKMLQKLQMPIILREFESGVKALQLACHSDEAVAEDMYNLLKQRTFLTAEEVAQMLGISVILAKEKLITSEKYSRACRDESIEGLRFYLNKFVE